jgi:hypothetical protein
MDRSSFAVAGAVLVITVGVLAQDAPKAERPEIKVGDSWSYDRVNRAGGRLDVRREVKAVSTDSLTVVVTDAAGTTEQQWTPELNYMRGEGKRVVRPHTQLVSFPMTVGGQWKVETKGVNAGGRDLTAEGTCKVLSFEKMNTKAGVFDTFKVDCDVEFYIYGGRPIRGRDRYVYWYAPAVRGEARAERLTRDDLTVFFDWTQELVSTTVK